MIALHPRARAWGALRGIAYAEPGTVFVGLDGTTVRIREDGGADPWPPFQYRSIASDPTAVRRSTSSTPMHTELAR